MKKVFIRIRQWILKQKKRLIYGMLAFFIGQICFLGIWDFWIDNQVFAQTQNTATQSNTSLSEATKWHEKLSFIQKLIYVLIYPLLVVAWKLVDNSFVYWEIFWFDAVLWKLWNIVKNLANFWLWFMFIFYIFKYLITDDKKLGPKQIIIKSLIAWIWIQASWFAMAALIDMSTILTYWIWWLPISVLSETNWDSYEDSLKYNPYIMKNLVYVDWKDLDTTDIYLTNSQTGNIQPGVYYISSCRTFNYGTWDEKEELIIAPKNIYYVYRTWDVRQMRSTDENRCHYYGQIYYFWGSNFKRGENNCKIGDTEDSCKENQSKYTTELWNKIDEIIGKSSTWEVVEKIRNAELLQLWDAHSTWWVLSSLWTIVYSQDEKYGLDLYNKWTWEDWNSSRLQDIMSWHSYVWIFTALYSSLLNMWNWIVPSNNWTFSSLLAVAISLWHVIAIWIPLIAVSVLFMMRIWILWMAIALSPMIILLRVFGLDEKIGKDWPLKYLVLKNLIPIIFSPAIICFAISISTVLVSIISKLNFSAIGWSEILWWLIKMDVWWLPINLWKFVISVLWIAVTRFLVWMALKNSELWKSGIIKWLESLAKTSLWSIPIVPIPWKDKKWVSFIWANSAFGLNGKEWVISSVTRNIKSTYDSEDQKALNEWLDPQGAAKKAAEKRAENRLSSYENKLVSLSADKIESNWLSQKIELDDSWETLAFNEIKDISAKKNIIKKINDITDENVRKAFGKVPEIEIWEWSNREVYKFADWKYVLQENSWAST